LENFKITEEKLFMTVTQTKNSSNSIASALKTNGFKQLLAVGSIAMGVTATISAAPAQAASLAGGSFNFGGAVSDFYFAPGSAPTTFDATFNVGGAQTNVTQSTTPFNTVVAPVGTYTYASTTPVTFSKLGGSVVGTNGYLSSFFYEMLNPLVFTLANNTTFTIGAGSTFQVGYTNDGTAARNLQGINFSLLDNTSYYTNNGDVTNTDGAAFTFSDASNNNNGSNGTYSAPTTTANQPVPEPFTIIGTLVGGTAAFRMRKKLAEAAKK
jgi:hypothetical protein